MNSESDSNSTIILKVEISPRDYVILIGTYREWKHPGAPNALSTSGIALQVQRLKQIKILITKSKALGHPIILGGDMNIDRNPKNNINVCADLRELSPIQNDIINSSDLAILNKEPTWSRPGQRKSLLDLLFVDKPQMVLRCLNIPNSMSEHSGVKLKKTLI